MKTNLTKTALAALITVTAGFSLPTHANTTPSSLIISPADAIADQKALIQDTIDQIERVQAANDVAEVALVISSAALLGSAGMVATKFMLNVGTVGGAKATRLDNVLEFLSSGHKVAKVVILPASGAAAIGGVVYFMSSRNLQSLKKALAAENEKLSRMERGLLNLEAQSLKQSVEAID